MRLVLVALALLAGGCAASRQLTPARHADAQVLAAPFERVWGALIASIAERSLPIQAIEKSSGIVATSFVMFDTGNRDQELKRVSMWRGCMLCVMTNGRFTINAVVTAVGPDSTRVRATAHVETYEAGLTKQWHVVRSSGAIEADLLEDIRSRLGP